MERMKTSLKPSLRVIKVWFKKPNGVPEEVGCLFYGYRDSPEPESEEAQTTYLDGILLQAVTFVWSGCQVEIEPIDKLATIDKLTITDLKRCVQQRVNGMMRRMQKKGRMVKQSSVRFYCQKTLDMDQLAEGEKLSSESIYMTWYYTEDAYKGEEIIRCDYEACEEETFLRQLEYIFPF